MRYALILAILSALVLAVAGFGTRAELWHFRTGFTLLRVGAWLGLAAAAFAVITIVRTRPDGKRIALAAGALAVGLAVAYIPWNQRRLAMTVPAIHDITTDTDDPPLFVAILPRRASAMNPPEYLGGETAAKQREAYPDVLPLIVDEPIAVVFAEAVERVKDRGWDLVAADREAGRIEATATTFWFGFKDDVVLRLRAEGPSRTRVDMRSKSRVGKSDVGTNARRIREFLKELRGD
jgi:hypothetical protein